MFKIPQNKLISTINLHLKIGQFKNPSRHKASPLYDTAAIIITQDNVCFKTTCSNKLGLFCWKHVKCNTIAKEGVKQIKQTLGHSDHIDSFLGHCQT